ncbi:MAG: glycerate kinase, partial [Mycobacteriales bacterium]
MARFARAAVPVVVAPDKFRGSLDARAVAEHLSRGLLAANPQLQLRRVAVADGGEGTLAALVGAGFEFRPVVVSGPTGTPVRSGFALRDGVAVVELADVVGMHRLPGGQPAPLTAGTRGVGEMIRAALDAGVREVVLAVGGSASTDGGAGMLQALGARLTDARGRDLASGGGSLGQLAAIDTDQLDPRLAAVTMTLARDVDNPLCGVDGAARSYAPQKGADPAQVALLEAGLRHYANLVAAKFGATFADLPGAGAAGGVGFASLAVLKAVSRSGVDLILELVGLNAQLDGARLVVTGEGSLDAQTLRGKTPLGVAAVARARGIPVVAV